MADTKIIVDCSTGEVSEVELTAEEIAQREADAAAFEAEQPMSAVESPLAAPVTALPERHRDDELLTEPLSQRELEVLRLLNTELSGPEIARELVIALSTVRTHTKNIYNKLNVNNRRAAVKRAVELNLI